jgi:ribonuclease P protein component
LRLSRSGYKTHSENFVVISKTNDKGESRVGITVSGKVGNSVIRNRIKRQVREFFRRQRSTLPIGVDFLVIARTSAVSLPSNALNSELAKSFSPQRGRRQE